MSSWSLKLFTTLIAFIGQAFAVINANISADALSACHALQAVYPNQVVYNALDLNPQKDYDYEQATQRYWSMANADNIPACVFLPETANMTAFAVQVLNKYTSVPWAVKGGGHNPNVGFSSTAGGILLAMENFANTTLDAQGLAHVGPGARWVDALTVLDTYGKAIVGGRLGDVGVAGYTLGGGLSFLSTEYGLACDNIVNFQGVTADGRVLNANSTSNSDLFYALKGGGNQFLIITDFVFQTIPIGKVWGGTKIYGKEAKDALINAVSNLTSNYYDPKAAVIVTSDYTIQNLVDIFVVFYFYNSPEGPGTILDEFLAIPALEENVSVQSYPSLLNANSAFSLTGQRYLIRAETIPNLPAPAGPDVYSYLYQNFTTLAALYQAQTLTDNLVFSFAFQPLPATISSASNSRSKNTLSLDPANGDRMWLEFDVSWLSPLTDAAAAKFADGISGGVVDFSRRKYAGVKPTHWTSGGDETGYNPLFMNDAMFDQQPLQRYGQDVYAQLKQTQRKWDPKGFFSTRTGGFKYV